MKSKAQQLEFGIDNNYQKMNLLEKKTAIIYSAIIQRSRREAAAGPANQSAAKLK